MKRGGVFRQEWRALALPALLATRVEVRPAVTIGIEIGGPPLQLRATGSGFEVGPRDGTALAATVRAAFAA